MKTHNDCSYSWYWDRSSSYPLCSTFKRSSRLVLYQDAASSAYSTCWCCLTAELKANENKSLASTITPEYLKYQQNEILQEAMKNGNIQKILINGAPVLSFDSKVLK